MPPSAADTRHRSLLQKAVRRGHVDLALTVGALLGERGVAERRRFPAHAVAITLAECWPLADALHFNRRLHSKLAPLVRAARSQKCRDAAGLGYLGQALAEGDLSVLEAKGENRLVRMVASAIQRPEAFWAWTAALPEGGGDRSALLARARRYRRAGTPRDRAVTLAAACLATQAAPPPVLPAAESGEPFPYWVALDVHTPEGRRVYHDVARDLFIPLPQLEWVGYYFEGSRSNRTQPSPWWERWSRWRFRRLGLNPEEAHLLWEPARAQIVESLMEESRMLHRQVYDWKMAHLERIALLRKEVELLLLRHHPGGGGDRQIGLF
jgi:hypothetical protein